jgi:hypothetical protein
MNQVSALPGRVRRRLAGNALSLKYLVRGWRAGDLFNQVETYCMFVGYPRSGHTLIGALLDAHPDAIIGNGVDALKFVKLGFGRQQLFSLLLEDSQLAARDGRKNNNYSYVVPNQWQGKFRTLKVIGDKRGGLSTRSLALDPALLTRLRQTVGAKLRVIHIVRNPYDNIATICLRRADQSLEKSIHEYFALCRKVGDIKSRLEPAELIEMRHEAFVADPRGGLTDYCRLLGLDAPPDYLEDCAGTVFEAPRRTRFKVEWAAADIENVARQMEAFPFLVGYHFDEG